MIGGLDTQLVHEFFQGFVNHAGVTLHIDNLKGVNAHHQCRDHLQGLRPRAAHGAHARSARGGANPVHQGRSLSKIGLQPASSLREQL
jgi:imidazoleglycerol-phosphate dehydratase